jgi:hypothetical protein
MTAPIYNPKVRMFYGTLGSSDSRITPAPLLNISTELSYSNDTIIGYNYVVNLTGQITAVDLSDGTSVGEFGVGSIIDHAHKIRKVLSQNGNILTVTDEYGSEVPILKAKGGILRSFDISDSPNNWINYVNYTATIEFQAIEFIGASWKSYIPEDCSNIFLSSNTYSADNAGILDVSKYKIKSFDDSWSFNFDENEAYHRVKNTDTGFLNIDNSGFTIEYSINATGKNAYVYTDEDSSDVKIIPAWEQAKNFVQYRLHEQVTKLVNNFGVLNTNKGSACSPTGELISLTQPDSPGLMQGLGGFDIFNEVVNCDVSESEGSFSVSYSAIVKRNTYNNYSSVNTKHKISKSYKTTNNNGIPITNISIEGNIEGLIPGGLINYPDSISLPSSGKFFLAPSSGKPTLYGNKYGHAKELLDKIYEDNDYNGGTGQSGKRDLKQNFKQLLGVTYEALNSSASQNDEIPDGPHPISFNLTHDYINGTINYSVEYSSNAACGRKLREISIQTSSSVPVYAQFDIPNGGSVPIFQPLNTRTASSVTATITGVDLSETGQPTSFSIHNEFNNVEYESFPVDIPLPGTFILTASQVTRNPIDGSFTATKTFICNTNGCDIN